MHGHMHLPEISSLIPSGTTFLGHYAMAHIPLPILVIYALSLSLSSIIPPVASFAATLWIIAYQIGSSLKKKHPPLPPIDFIRECISCFAGVYLIAILCLMPTCLMPGRLINLIKYQSSLSQSFSQTANSSTTAINPAENLSSQPEAKAKANSGGFTRNSFAFKI